MGRLTVTARQAHRTQYSVLHVLPVKPEGMDTCMHACGGLCPTFWFLWVGQNQDFPCPKLKAMTVSFYMILI